MKATTIAPPKSHKHEGCGHFDFCHDSKPYPPDCRKCAAASFNRAMAEIYGKGAK